MIISMKKSATAEQIDHVKTLIESFGYRVHESVGAERVIFGAIGDERGKERLTCLEAQPGVEKVLKTSGVNTIIPIVADMGEAEVILLG